ncbi:MAG: DUF4388 domain-containing protein [Actinobacteria bacterium]|nr:DUF4388 domain-containing protein [Actinomycetota bacterium]
MALRGNLKDFSLPDVFQLVQLSGKTGVLRIQGVESEGSIWFRDGDVFFAQSNWRREQLGERLVSAQRITPAALARALELRESEPEGGRRLGEILVNEGYITQQVLETFVQEQIQDTIFDLMRWDEGEFDFEVLPEVVHEDIGLSVSVENIVMEGSRRLEEWQRIKKKVPSTDMVFKMATAPGEGTFEISLKPIEWALLLLIDGTRSVRELATETHSTDFEVARVVYGLFSAGLLEVPSDEEIEKLRADRARRADKRAELDAKRAAKEAEQGAEALDLEAQLAAQAEARRAQSEELPAAEAAEPEEEAVAEEPPAIVEPPAEPRVVEEPEFLGVAAEAPSSEDMAVFEQMMASVLTPQTAEEAPEVAEPEATPEPEPEFVLGLDFVPEPEPALEPEPEPELLAVPEAPLPEVELSIAEIEAAAAAAAAAQAEAEGEAIGFGAIPASDIESIPAPPVAEGEPESEPVAATGDFETDLRALGLGEYPEELLQPEPPTETRLPMSEVEAGVTEAPPSVVETPAEPGAVGDELDSLLASLDSGETTGVISSGTDYGMAGDTSGGVLSTDAFLAEFDSGVGLSGGLGDELTALTGGASGSSGRARPQATVTRLPEAGAAHVLHRDQMVDKSLLEKIIEGIENL